jgi:hypothetical protein
LTTGREIRRGTMLDEFRIVSLPTWVGKRQVTAKTAGAAIAFRIQRWLSISASASRRFGSSAMCCQVSATVFIVSLASAGEKVLAWVRTSSAFSRQLQFEIVWPLRCRPAEASAN